MVFKFTHKKHQVNGTDKFVSVSETVKKKTLKGINFQKSALRTSRTRKAEQWNILAQVRNENKDLKI